MRGGGIRWVAWALVAATLVLAVVLASRFGGDPGLVDSPLLDQAAPDFEMPFLDEDGTVSLEDFQGEIVVLNFFASWCLECRKEHDDFLATADAFSGDGVSFIQAAYQESAADSVSYLDQAGRSQYITYTLDEGSRTAIAYGVFGIPETFFIDEDGVIVGKIVGETDAQILGAAIDTIKRGGRPGQQVTGDTQQRQD